MTLRLLIVFLVVASAACSPVVDGADLSGDESACSAALRCDRANCGGTDYVISCELDEPNQIYRCNCSADGVDGEEFSEAGICEKDGDAFTNLDAADAAAHAVEDCGFPLSIDGALAEG